ncbi:recombination mediator RecR [Elioraea thermophila]|uniref:recombination mediator RecR n=1 Tax=Elioraea thermophila TaxID=2185104 RepID=UPI000DF3065E|nr:recombination mediator RecR [Elioraea thermophila]
MGAELERLIAALARLPGLGPRSARRAALALVEKRETLLEPLVAALEAAAATIRPCSVCGNLDSVDPCSICTDATREKRVLCVVETVADLWALERARAHRGLYHVLGGTLSALAGRGPDELRIDPLVKRVASGEVSEVILATSATVDGQATAHLVADRLSAFPVTLTRLAYGLPIGGELGSLDDGTLAAALRARRPL